MNRFQLLAAEIYGYGYANYADHLGIGNIRYDHLMPEMAETLEMANRAGWPPERLARKVKVTPAEATELLDSFKRAKQIVDAGNPAELFRTAVRFSIKDAALAGLKDEEAVEKLVTQICYRASDLAYLLKSEGTSLSRYSRHLRKEPDVEYHDGYFDEEE